jgi:MoxR-like ATPase
MMNLYEILNKEGYVITPEKALSVELALHTTKPVAGAFLKGNAGSGKTSLVEVLGRGLGREVFFYQCFPGTREEDLLIKLIPDEKKKSGIRLARGVVMEAAMASMTRPVFLMLDEWDKTRPSADSFLLDFLQSGRINFAGQSCTAKLENIVVWVALNEEREVSEPLLRRLPVINFEPLPASLVRQALNLSHPAIST